MHLIFFFCRPNTKRKGLPDNMSYTFDLIVKFDCIKLSMEISFAIFTHRANITFFSIKLYEKYKWRMSSHNQMHQEKNFKHNYFYLRSIKRREISIMNNKQDLWGLFLYSLKFFWNNKQAGKTKGYLAYLTKTNFLAWIQTGIDVF